MKKVLIILLLIFHGIISNAQSTFKVVFKTYTTGTITHTYLYEFDYKNEFILWPTDSIVTYTSKDSMVIMELDYPLKAKMKRTVSYLNTRKQVIKTEYYIEDYLAKTAEWKYDTFNRVTFNSIKETGSRYNNFQRRYSYSSEKTNEGICEKENCYNDGHLEFCTMNYYDKKHCIYKQVRNNDAGKAVHIETYIYDKAGRLKERELYFPEFGVTKYYNETPADAKCTKTAFIPNEKIGMNNMELVLKRELLKNKQILLTDECSDLEYKFMNPVNTIIIKKQKEHNKRTIAISIKEKMK